MIIEKIDIKKVRANPKNPRIIKDDKYKKLVKSIQDFPEMLEIRPVVVNSDMMVLGGNMRLKACQEAGLKEIPIIKADTLTAEQQKEFIIKDNSNFGEWDFDVLANEWKADELLEWGVEFPVDWAETETDNKDLSDKINPSFRIEIECISEKEQEKLYNDFIKKGYKCRLLTL